MTFYKIDKKKNKDCDLIFFNRLKKIIKNPVRIFFLKAKKNCLRGNHAHKLCTQYFLSIYGVIELEVDNGKNKKKYILNDTKLLKVKPLNWVTVKLKKNQILAVLCDENYKKDEYIRNYKKFQNLIIK